MQLQSCLNSLLSPAPCTKGPGRSHTHPTLGNRHANLSHCHKPSNVTSSQGCKWIKFFFHFFKKPNMNKNEGKINKWNLNNYGINELINECHICHIMILDVQIIPEVWVMDFMISIFFYCICLTLHNSEMYLYKVGHVLVYICIFPWWERCSPTNYWSLFLEWINYTAHDTLSLLVHSNFFSLALTSLSLSSH